MEQERKLNQRTRGGVGRKKSELGELEKLSQREDREFAEQVSYLEQQIANTESGLAKPSIDKRIEETKSEIKQTKSRIRNIQERINKVRERITILDSIKTKLNWLSYQLRIKGNGNPNAVPSYNFLAKNLRVQKLAKEYQLKQKENQPPIEKTHTQTKKTTVKGLNIPRQTTSARRDYDAR